MLEPLATALCQCVSIILLGLLCRLLAILSPADAAGLSAFVGRLSMPALLFLSMAELNVHLTEWRLVAALCAAKTLVFAATAGLCFATSVVKARSRAEPGAGQHSRHSAWLCRAGLYSIFVTQSNDFALGMPLCAAIWGVPPPAPAVPAPTTGLHAEPRPRVPSPITPPQLCLVPAPTRTPHLSRPSAQVIVLYSCYCFVAPRQLAGARRGSWDLSPPPPRVPLAPLACEPHPSPASGDRFIPIIFLIAPLQLAVLNPIAFALLEGGADSKPSTDDRAGRASEACCEAPSEAPPQQATDGRLLPRSEAAPQRGASRGSAGAVLRVCRGVAKVGRSPLVFSVLLGGVLRACLLAAGDPPVPAWIHGTLLPLKQAFTATALITLGMSLRTQSEALTSQPLASVGLLCGKAIVMPLLTRGLAQTLGVTDPDAQAFAFLYGMLPSAPTVVVVAREFGQHANAQYLAAIQFVGLILAVS